jgi:hypothetical protein
VTLRTHLRVISAVLLLVGTGALLAGSLADPTRPLAPYHASARRVIAEFSVTAVLNSPTRRVAIVNGLVVGAGARIGDVTILEVLPDGVRYQRAGRQFTIHIAPLSAKVRAPQANQPQTAKVDPTSAATHEDSP